jgi:hypothetical protein
MVFAASVTTRWQDESMTVKLSISVPGGFRGIARPSAWR